MADFTDYFKIDLNYGTGTGFTEQFRFYENPPVPATIETPTNSSDGSGWGFQDVLAGFTKVVDTAAGVAKTVQSIQNTGAQIELNKAMADSQIRLAENKIETQEKLAILQTQAAVANEVAKVTQTGSKSLFSQNSLSNFVLIVGLIGAAVTISKWVKK